MPQPPVIAKFTLGSLKPIEERCKAARVDLELVGVKPKGAGVYANGNKNASNCDAFVLKTADGSVAYPVKSGAHVTLYRPLTYSGPEVVCLIEDLADWRTFTVHGDGTCKVRDVRPVQPPAPAPLRSLFGI